MPAPGAPLFQAATANLNPWTEARVDTKNPHRGPLLIISGEKDHTVPWAVANASYKKQAHKPGVTEIVEMPNRGHALTIDNGWREVADTALTFVQRFVRRAAAAASIRADPRQSRVGRRRRPAERRGSNRLASVSARVHRRRSAWNWVQESHEWWGGFSGAHLTQTLGHVAVAGRPASGAAPPPSASFAAWLLPVPQWWPWGS